jgi:hypothetical protein
VARRVRVTVLSLPPRRRDPPRQPACDGPCCLRPESAGSASRIGSFGATSAFTCVTARVTHSPPPSVAWSMGFRASVSLRPAIRVTRRLALASTGLTPAERVSLHWTHGFEPVFQP